MNNIDPEQFKPILLNALRDGANYLANETKRQLRASLGQSANSMERGVRTKVDRAYNEVMVNIMGDYRLKWFEKGTRERHLKKNGANTGAIGGKHFFQTARGSNVESVINQSITEQLNRL